MQDQDDGNANWLTNAISSGGIRTISFNAIQDNNFLKTLQKNFSQKPRGNRTARFPRGFRTVSTF
jgi:enoyl-[acyl-carrier-protein] reductase (NADH)